MAKAARQPHTQQTCYLRKGITAANMGTTVNVGTIPAGAIVTQAGVYIQTAFDGTTPTLDVGTVADPNGFVAAAALGVVTVVLGAVPTTLAATYSETAARLVTAAVVAGSGNTVGAGEIFVQYIPNNDD